MGETREIKRLLTLRRSAREQVRVSFDEFDAPDGRTLRYVNARKWAKGSDGQWRPTATGITIRPSELGEVIEGLAQLHRAISNAAAPSSRGSET